MNKKLVLAVTTFTLLAAFRCHAAVSEVSRFFVKDGELVSNTIYSPVWSMTFSCRLTRGELTAGQELTETRLWIESTLQLNAEGIQQIDIELVFMDKDGEIVEVVDYWRVNSFSSRDMRKEESIVVPPETDSISFESSTRGGRPFDVDLGRRFPGPPRPPRL